MHCKRQQTPNKQGDDGWKSVHYEGTQLDVFRRQFVQQSNAEETEVRIISKLHNSFFAASTSTLSLSLSPAILARKDFAASPPFLKVQM